MPFDALKGLQEELRRRERKMLREERRQLSEEEAERLSHRLLRLKKGDTVEAVFYEDGYYLTVRGVVDTVNRTYGFFVLDGHKLFFSDLYRLRTDSVR